MDADTGRRAAYADLVSAVLDLRSPEATAAFDAALSAAVASGSLSDEIARQLRWLQRQSERAVIEHAEAVLPPALVALQCSLTPLDSPTVAEPVGNPVEQPSEPPAEPSDEDEPDDFDEEPEPAPVVHLQARRLLVAGLRPLPDPAHRGTLPS